MSQAVTLKSYKNGIKLRLDAEIPFPELIREIGKTCAEAREFLGAESVVLSLEGRPLTDAEENEILDTIRSSCDLHVICLIGNDEETGQSFLRALEQLARRLDPEEAARFYRGSLRNRQRLELEESVVILGDVNSGCTVSSKGCVIVLGGLYGECYAGGATNENAFVAALELDPEELTIGGVFYAPQEKPKHLIKPKVQPKIASVKDGEIRMDALTRSSLEKLYGFAKVPSEKL